MAAELEKSTKKLEDRRSEVAGKNASLHEDSAEAAEHLESEPSRSKEDAEHESDHQVRGISRCLN